MVMVEVSLLTMCTRPSIRVVSSFCFFSWAEAPAAKIDSSATAHVEVAQSIFRSLGVPVQFGGGIRTLEDAARLLDLGAARVILGTIAAEQPELVEEAVRRFGEAVAVGIDARGGEVAVRGWVQSGRTTALD